MSLNLKNVEVVRLAADVAAMANETKTEAIRRALLERRERLKARVSPRGRLQEYMEKQVWPLLPAKALGRALSRKEEDKILGYGPEGF